MKDAYISVIYMTNTRETEIIRVHGVYKHRQRVNELLDSLNRKYFGYGTFTTREIAVC